MFEMATSTNAQPASIAIPRFRSLRRTALRVLAGLIGPALLGYLVLRADPALVWKQAQSVGWGLGLVVMLGGLPQVVRTWAWRQAFTRDLAALSWSRSLGSQLASDALGQLGVAGKLVGEGLRVSWLNGAVPVADAISASAIDGGMHIFTAVLVTVLGIAAGFTIAPLSGRWRMYAMVLPFVLMGFVILAVVALANRWPLMGNAARLIGRVPKLRSWMGGKIAVIDSAELNLLTFRQAKPAGFWQSFALHLLWHLLTISEVYLILRFMGIGISGIGALAMEGLTKVINLVGTVNPGNVGTYEAGNMAMARMFGLTGSAGLALALCRRVRGLFWAGVGALCLVAMKKTSQPQA
jgi:hypothetical protein